jgi:predicted amino acid dehydrogenase
MKAFAYLACPKTPQQLRRILPFTRFVPQSLLKPILNKFINPAKIARYTIYPKKGRGILGYFLLCPLFNTHGPIEDPGFIYEKILSAAELAKQLGAQILGINGCTTLLQEKEPLIAKKSKIPITTGNTFTAWSIIEAIYRTTRIQNIPLATSTMLIIGATTPVASLCAQRFSPVVKHLILACEKKEKLNQLKEKLSHHNSLIITITESLPDAIPEADIIVNTLYSNNILQVQQDRLKPGVLICTFTCNDEKHTQLLPGQNIHIVRAGLVKPSLASQFSPFKGLPPAIIPTHLAETLLLTIEKRFVSYSVGEYINPDKLEEIANIAVKHGFEIWAPEAPVL